MGGPTISDRNVSPGLPYNLDSGSTSDQDAEDDAASMMRSNHVPRNRHFWSVVPWLVHDAGMFAAEPIAIVRGSHRYTLPVTARDEVPNYFPVAATASQKGTVFRKKGLCDVFMYRTGHDAFTAHVLKGASKAPYDALIVARLKLALDMPGYSFDEASVVARSLPASVDRTFTGRSWRPGRMSLGRRTVAGAPARVDARGGEDPAGDAQRRPGTAARRVPPRNPL